MATFVIVHSAWVGGWSWTPIARLLRAEGHEVYVPSLTGLGEKQHLLGPEIDLSTHVADVANLIEAEGLSDFILVGHSYGGMVIAGVSAICGEKIRSLVHVEGFVPEDGQSMWDLVDDEVRAWILRNARRRPGLIELEGLPPGVEPPPNLADAPPLTPPRAGPQPLLTLLEPVKLGGQEGLVRNHTYVLAARPPLFQLAYDRAAAAGWRTVKLDAAHFLNLEDPEGVAQVLGDEAAR